MACINKCTLVRYLCSSEPQHYTYIIKNIMNSLKMTHQQRNIFFMQQKGFSSSFYLMFTTNTQEKIVDIGTFFSKQNISSRRHHHHHHHDIAKKKPLWACHLFFVLYKNAEEVNFKHAKVPLDATSTYILCLYFFYTLYVQCVFAMMLICDMIALHCALRSSTCDTCDRRGWSRPIILTHMYKALACDVAD